jgi:hypothetical protein
MLFYLSVYSGKNHFIDYSILGKKVKKEHFNLLLRKLFEKYEKKMGC